MIAYKFVDWEVSPLESLKDEKVYKLKEKTLAGGKLTREEKDWLYGAMQGTTYTKTGICLGGWCFDFSGVLTLYWVKYHSYGISEVYAPDKMSIRNRDKYMKINKIVEVK